MNMIGKAEGAFELLKRAIQNGAHAPGAPLRVAGLSKAYGISATPLREALSRLEEKKLVVASPNCGWRVASVSFEELEDLEHARLALEENLLHESIAHGGLEWEANVIASHHRLKRTPQPIGRANVADRERWVEAHDGFHACLVSGGKSSWLKAFHETTLEQLQRYHQALLFHPGAINPEAINLEAIDPSGVSEHAPETLALLHRALAHEHHSKLMEATLDRDQDTARTLLREHVQITLSVYRSIVSERGEQNKQYSTKRA